VTNDKQQSARHCIINWKNTLHMFSNISNCWYGENSQITTFNRNCKTTIAAKLKTVALLCWKTIMRLCDGK